MPGIAGHTFFGEKSEQERMLEDMLQCIKHKPWQKTESYYAPFTHIGRVHLGTFNPEQQPVFDESHELFAFMYGKIYGYGSEVDRLEGLGHKFSIRNDPEYCLHAYEEYAKDFAKDLNGSFLLVIGDLRNKQVMIVNDRFGTRPLYYIPKENGIIFASEVKAILQDKSLLKEMDYDALADYLVLGEILGDKTLFRGIKVLPPASILRSKEDGVSIYKYWDLIYDYEENFNDEELIADNLVKTLKNAVSKRLGFSHRYAHGLSGGLDSRAVLTAFPDAEKCNVIAFTFGDNPGSDEIRIARIVAHRLNVKHTTMHFDASDLVNYLEEVVYLSDGMASIALTFMPYICGQVRRIADVHVTGFELDKLLGGAYLNAHLFKVKSDIELARFLYSKKALFPESLLSELLTEEYYQRVKGKAFKSVLTALKESKTKAFADKSDYYFIVNDLRRNILMGSILRRNYTEETLPTLDNEFIEVISRIPAKLRFNHRIYVKFLKRLSPEMARIPYQSTMLPPTMPFILWQLSRKIHSISQRARKLIFYLTRGRVLIKNKHGYLNVAEYLKANEEWRRIVHKTLLTRESEIYRRGIFRIDGVRKLVEKHESGIRDRSRRIAHIINLELFIRKFDLS
ncbi:MAG: asparagine synthetase B [Candidatus Bathyarchaeia archaeon]